MTTTKNHLDDLSGDQDSGQSESAEPQSRLSPRETAVLAVVRTGLTTKEIAARLHVSRSTVNYHLANIYRKLKAHSRVEALNAFDELVTQTQIDVERRVLELGTRLAAGFGLPSDAPRRAAYYQVSGDTVAPLMEVDAANTRAGDGFAVVEHPFFYEIAASGQPRSGALDSRLLGPQVRRVAAATGVTHGAGVPVHRGSALHGILVLGARGEDVPREQFRRLVDLGRLVEFALQPIRSTALGDSSLGG